MAQTDPALEVLHVGSFAEPRPRGGNRLLATQLGELGRQGVVTACLTWPIHDTWQGPRPGPDSTLVGGRPWLDVTREGGRYHVVSLPPIWSERVLSEAEWEAAVAWAGAALARLRPRIVHLHYWQNLWFVLEAARRAGIQTVFSAYDYGIACLRTVLVTGAGELCRATPGVATCSACIVRGRGALGLANELAAALPLGERLLTRAYGAGRDGPLARRGGVRMPVWRRVGLSLDRLGALAPGVGALMATSPFAAGFFASCGFRAERIHVVPWFADHPAEREPLPGDEELRLGFCGRVAPEKGLDVLLGALELVRSPRPVRLQIAGAIDSGYAEALQRRFPHAAGEAKVEWLGWQEREALPAFLRSLHALVVPSIWYDNTPVALVEALAQGRPVVCTDVPSMTHLVEDGRSGFTFPLGDQRALAGRLERLAREPGLVREFAAAVCAVPSLEEYCAKLVEVYRALPAAT